MRSRSTSYEEGFARGGAIAPQIGGFAARSFLIIRHQSQASYE
jgi:hypothetical protein